MSVTVNSLYRLFNKGTSYHQYIKTDSAKFFYI
jgi:hypothetical protein